MDNKTAAVTMRNITKRFGQVCFPCAGRANKSQILMCMDSSQRLQVSYLLHILSPEHRKIKVLERLWIFQW